MGVDADTVFLPMRLRTKLSGQKITSSGIYLENCKYVNYGFFGNLEVISHQGFSTFLANLEDCVSALNWKGREKATGMEAWGRTSSCRGAWTCTVWTRLRLSISRLTRCAGLSGPRARRATRSGGRIAH